MAAAGASNGAASPKVVAADLAAEPRGRRRAARRRCLPRGGLLRPRGNYGKLRACSDASDISAFAAQQAEREIEPATDAVADAIGEALAETATTTTDPAGRQI